MQGMGQIRTFAQGGSPASVSGQPASCRLASSSSVVVLLPGSELTFKGHSVQSHQQ